MNSLPLPAPALTHLRTTGKVLVFVPAMRIRLLRKIHAVYPVYPYIAKPGYYDANTNDRGEVSALTEAGAVCLSADDYKWIVPYAPGDVIAVGDLKAIVVEVLPPVRVKELTAEEIEAMGVDVAHYLPVVIRPGINPDEVANTVARCQFRQRHPNLAPDAWGWRVMLTVAKVAEPKEE